MRARGAVLMVSGFGLVSCSDLRPRGTPAPAAAAGAGLLQCGPRLGGAETPQRHSRSLPQGRRAEGRPPRPPKEDAFQRAGGFGMAVQPAEGLDDRKVHVHELASWLR